MKRIMKAFACRASDHRRVLPLRADRFRRIDRVIDYFGGLALVAGPTRVLARPLRNR